MRQPISTSIHASRRRRSSSSLISRTYRRRSRQTARPRCPRNTAFPPSCHHPPRSPPILANQVDLHSHNDRLAPSTGASARTMQAKACAHLDPGAVAQPAKGPNTAAGEVASHHRLDPRRLRLEQLPSETPSLGGHDTGKSLRAASRAAGSNRGDSLVDERPSLGTAPVKAWHETLCSGDSSEAF